MTVYNCTWTVPASGLPITGYALQRQRSGAFSALASLDANTTNYVDAAGQTGDSYRVAALSAAGQSEWSNEVAMGTPLEPLTYSPPAGWETWDTFQMPATTTGTIRLPNKKVRLLNPPGDGIIRSTQTVTILHGYSYVWFGGHILKEDVPPTTGTPDSYTETVLGGLRPYDYNSTAPYSQANIDNTADRHAYHEGLLLDGYWLGDGIKLYTKYVTPGGYKSIVTFQNTRIEIGMFGSLTAGRPHPDIITPEGGMGELRVDRLTGLCYYQGMLMYPITSGNAGPTYFRRVNLRPNTNNLPGVTEAYDRSVADNDPSYLEPRYMFSMTGGSGAIRTDDDVWIYNPYLAEPVNHGFTNMVNGTPGSDAKGNYRTFPGSTGFNGVDSLRSIDNSTWGKVRLGDVADFVPRNVPGPNYPLPGQPGHPGYL